MKTLCMAGAIALALASPAARADEKPSPALMRQLTSQFRDPSSVQWFNLHFVRGDGANFQYLCGEVSARNGFGGLNGREPFVAVLGIGLNKKSPPTITTGYEAQVDTCLSPRQSKLYWLSITGGHSDHAP